MKTKEMKIAMIFLLLFTFISCEKSDKPKEKLNFALTSFKHTDCKKDTRKTGEDEYIEYKTVNDHFLQIGHINTIFNCCPEELTTTATLVKDTIKIVEKEAKQGCKCTCKYDFHFQVGALKYGKYHILVSKKNEKTIVFDVDFNSTTDGKYVIKKR